MTTTLERPAAFPEGLADGDVDRVVGALDELLR